MTTPNGSDEKRLYETIVEIPHYQCKSSQSSHYTTLHYTNFSIQILPFTLSMYISFSLVQFFCRKMPHWEKLLMMIYLTLFFCDWCFFFRKANLFAFGYWWRGDGRRGQFWGISENVCRCDSRDSMLQRFDTNQGWQVLYWLVGEQVCLEAAPDGG